MQKWLKRLAIATAIFVALVILAAVIVVKVLPIVIPDQTLADSDLIPVYVPVPESANPLPDLTEAFQRATAGDGSNHYDEIESLLVPGGGLDAIEALITKDSRHQAMKVAASSPAENWRFPEYYHHSQPLPTLLGWSGVFGQKVRYVDAPSLREDTGDEIDVDFWSMAGAYLRANVWGHLIVEMNQVTLGSMPTHFAEQRKKVRELLLACTAKRFELDKGRAPSSLAELVGAGYLEEGLADPITGGPLPLSR